MFPRLIALAALFTISYTATATDRFADTVEDAKPDYCTNCGAQIHKAGLGRDEPPYKQLLDVSHNPANKSKKRDPDCEIRIGYADQGPGLYRVEIFTPLGKNQFVVRRPLSSKDNDSSHSYDSNKEELTVDYGYLELKFRTDPRMDKAEMVSIRNSNLAKPNLVCENVHM